MKKLLMAAAAFVALPVMAQAQSQAYPGFYIGAEGGLNRVRSEARARCERHENVTSLLGRYGAAGFISVITGKKYPSELNKA